MMRSVRVYGGALLVGLFSIAPAYACLNDQELPNREREFRSQYHTEYVAQKDTPPPTLFSETAVLPTVGTILSLGATGLFILGLRRNS